MANTNATPRRFGAAGLTQPLFARGATGGVQPLQPQPQQRPPQAAATPDPRTASPATCMEMYGTYDVVSLNGSTCAPTPDEHVKRIMAEREREQQQQQLSSTATPTATAGAYKDASGIGTWLEHTSIPMDDAAAAAAAKAAPLPARRANPLAAAVVQPQPAAAAAGGVVAAAVESVSRAAATASAAAALLARSGAVGSNVGTPSARGASRSGGTPKAVGAGAGTGAHHLLPGTPKQAAVAATAAAPAPASLAISESTRSSTAPGTPCGGAAVGHGRTTPTAATGGGGGASTSVSCRYCDGGTGYPAGSSTAGDASHHRHLRYHQQSRQQQQQQHAPPVMPLPQANHGHIHTHNPNQCVSVSVSGVDDGDGFGFAPRAGSVETKVGESQRCASPSIAGHPTHRTASLSAGGGGYSQGLVIEEEVRKRVEAFKADWVETHSAQVAAAERMVQEMMEKETQLVLQQEAFRTRTEESITSILAAQQKELKVKFADEQAAIDAKRNELEEHRAETNARITARAAEVEASCAARQQEMDEMFASRCAELDERAERLHLEITSLREGIEAATQQKHAEFSAIQADLEARGAAIAAESADVAQRHVELDDQAARIAADHRQHLDNVELLRVKTDQLADLERAVLEREGQVATTEAGLEAARSGLDELAASLEDKQREIASREADITKERDALNELHADVKRVEAQLEARHDALQCAEEAHAQGVARANDAHAAQEAELQRQREAVAREQVVIEHDMQEAKQAVYDLRRAAQQEADDIRAALKQQEAVNAAEAQKIAAALEASESLVQENKACEAALEDRRRAVEQRDAELTTREAAVVQQFDEQENTLQAMVDRIETDREELINATAALKADQKRLADDRVMLEASVRAEVTQRFQVQWVELDKDRAALQAERVAFAEERVSLAEERRSDYDEKLAAARDAHAAELRAVRQVVDEERAQLQDTIATRVAAEVTRRASLERDAVQAAAAADRERIRAELYTEIYSEARNELAAARPPSRASSVGGGSCTGVHDGSQQEVLSSSDPAGARRNLVDAFTTTPDSAQLDVEEQQAAAAAAALDRRETELFEAEDALEARIRDWDTARASQEAHLAARERDIAEMEASLAAETARMRQLQLQQPPSQASSQPPQPVNPSTQPHGSAGGGGAGGPSPHLQGYHAFKEGGKDQVNAAAAAAASKDASKDRDGKENTGGVPLTWSAAGAAMAASQGVVVGELPAVAPQGRFGGPGGPRKTVSRRASSSPPASPRGPWSPRQYCAIAHPAGVAGPAGSRRSSSHDDSALPVSNILSDVMSAASSCAPYTLAALPPGVSTDWLAEHEAATRAVYEDIALSTLDAIHMLFYILFSQYYQATAPTTISVNSTFGGLGGGVAGGGNMSMALHDSTSSLHDIVGGSQGPPTRSGSVKGLPPAYYPSGGSPPPAERSATLPPSAPPMAPQQGAVGYHGSAAAQGQGQGGTLHSPTPSVTEISLSVASLPPHRAPSPLGLDGSFSFQASPHMRPQTPVWTVDFPALMDQMWAAREQQDGRMFEDAWRKVWAKIQSDAAYATYIGSRLGAELKLCKERLEEREGACRDLQDERDDLQVRVRDLTDGKRDLQMKLLYAEEDMRVRETDTRSLERQLDEASGNNTWMERELVEAKRNTKALEADRKRHHLAVKHALLTALIVSECWQRWTRRRDGFYALRDYARLRDHARTRNIADICRASALRKLAPNYNLMNRYYKLLLRRPTHKRAAAALLIAVQRQHLSVRFRAWRLFVEDKFLQGRHERASAMMHDLRQSLAARRGARRSAMERFDD